MMSLMGCPVGKKLVHIDHWSGLCQNYYFDVTASSLVNLYIERGLKVGCSPVVHQKREFHQKNVCRYEKIYNSDVTASASSLVH